MNGMLRQGISINANDAEYERYKMTNTKTETGADPSLKTAAMEQPREFNDIHSLVWARILDGADETGQFLQDQLIESIRLTEDGVETIMKAIGSIQERDLDLRDDSFVIHHCNMIQNGKTKLRKARAARKAIAEQARFYEATLTGNTIFDKMLGKRGIVARPFF